MSSSNIFLKFSNQASNHKKLAFLIFLIVLIECILFIDYDSFDLDAKYWNIRSYRVQDKAVINVLLISLGARPTNRPPIPSDFKIFFVAATRIKIILYYIT